MPGIRVLARIDSVMLRLLGLVVLLHGYIAWRLLPAMAPATTAAALTAGWLAASVALLGMGLTARRRGRPPLADGLALATWLAAGAFSSLLVLTVLRDVALLAGAALRATGLPAMALPPFAHASALAVPVLAASLTVIGFINARRRARVRSVDVPITDLPAALHGFTIAQITDLHVGSTIKRDYVQAVVDAVNDLQVDMIAVTGDLVDGSVGQLACHTEPLAQLAARHGAYFVTGNHEYYSGAPAWTTELRRLGMRVLVNEHVVLRHGGSSIVVAGVTDYSAHHFDPSQRSDPAAAAAGAPSEADVRILLAHQPRSAFAALAAGFDLQLSGHTHGGQFVPWNFFVRFQQPFTAGLHRLETLWIYVSRGTGYWGPPKRLGAPSEIARLRLVPRESTP